MPRLCPRSGCSSRERRSLASASRRKDPDRSASSTDTGMRKPDGDRLRPSWSMLNGRESGQSEPSRPAGLSTPPTGPTAVATTGQTSNESASAIARPFACRDLIRIGPSLAPAPNSAVKARSRRMIRAVDSRVTVETGAVDDSLISQPEISRRHRASRMSPDAGIHVTLLAQGRQRDPQQSLAVRAVG